jgi:hypothetical protein
MEVLFSTEMSIDLQWTTYPYSPREFIVTTVMRITNLMKTMSLNSLVKFFLEGSMMSMKKFAAVVWIYMKLKEKKTKELN